MVTEFTSLANFLDLCETGCHVGCSLVQRGPGPGSFARLRPASPRLFAKFVSRKVPTCVNKTPGYGTGRAPGEEYWYFALRKPDNSLDS